MAAASSKKRKTLIYFLYCVVLLSIISTIVFAMNMNVAVPSIFYFVYPTYDNTTDDTQTTTSTTDIVLPKFDQRWQSPFIFTVANTAQQFMAHNWALSLLRSNITDFKIFCVDDNAMDYLSQHLDTAYFEKIPPSILKVANLTTEEANNPIGYESHTFRKLGCIRPLLMRHVWLDTIANPTHNAIIYTDSDAVIFKDFRPYLVRNAANYDLFFGNDIWQKNNFDCQPNRLCTCLIGVNSFRLDNVTRESVDAFFENWFHNCIVKMRFDGDAAGMEYRDRHKYPENMMGILDCHAFPNGGFYQNERWRKAYLNNEEWTNDHDVYWIHANFMIGLDVKTEFLKSNNAWLI